MKASSAQVGYRMYCPDPDGVVAAGCPTWHNQVMRFGVGLLLFTGACAEGLEQYPEVTDLRVLAIRAEPPELLVDAPERAVSFHPLVVDPRGSAVDFSWAFCPVESERACLDYDKRRQEAAGLPGDTFTGVAAGGWPAELDQMRASQAGAGSALPTFQPSEQTAIGWWANPAISPYSVRPFDLTVSDKLFVFHILASGLGVGTGAWPSVTLEVRARGEALLSSKRFSVNIGDLTPFADVIKDMFGYDICLSGQTPETNPGCIPLRPHAANQNPVFASVEVSPGDSAIANFQAMPMLRDARLVGLVPLRAGESMRIRPNFTDESFESFQVLKADLNSRQIFVEDAKEDISVSWFASAGDLQDDLTWPKFTKTLDTAYTAPKQPPANTGGRVSVWMVARDQRGGEDWMGLELQIVP